MKKEGLANTRLPEDSFQKPLSHWDSHTAQVRHLVMERQMNKYLHSIWGMQPFEGCRLLNHVIGLIVTLRGDTVVAILPLSPSTIRKGKTKVKGNKEQRHTLAH